MRIITALLTMYSFVICFSAPAQWQPVNTSSSDNGPIYHLNGNVGIGTSSPADNLEVQAVNGGVLRLSNTQSSYLMSQSVTTGTIRNIARQWNSDFTSINVNETSSIKFGYNADANARVRDAAIRFYTQDDRSGDTQERMAILPQKITIGSNGGAATGYGAALHFQGIASNGDPMWIAKYSIGANQTELRVNVGDDLGQKEDKFVIGTNYWSDGEWHPHLAVLASGNVGVGTTDTRGYKLAVAGKTVTEEVVVKLETNWPDYVFADTYKLPSLSDLEQYIKANRHLPDVPTAEDVKDEGLSVGAMNAILLKKVEELTLHLIEQNRINTLQAERIDNLERDLEALKNR